MYIVPAAVDVGHLARCVSTKVDVDELDSATRERAWIAFKLASPRSVGGTHIRKQDVRYRHVGTKPWQAWSVWLHWCANIHRLAVLVDSKSIPRGRLDKNVGKGDIGARSSLTVLELDVAAKRGTDGRAISKSDVAKICVV